MWEFIMDNLTWVYTGLFVLLSLALAWAVAEFVLSVLAWRQSRRSRLKLHPRLRS